MLVLLMSRVLVQDFMYSCNVNLLRCTFLLTVSIVTNDPFMLDKGFVVLEVTINIMQGMQEEGLGPCTYMLCAD